MTAQEKYNYCSHLTTITKYGVTKKDFDYYAKNIEKVVKFVKTEKTDKKILTKK